MTAHDPRVRSSTWNARLPAVVAVVGAVVFVALGIWAMVDPRSFFERVATFHPYNQHLLQDIGAFQVGLGAVLLFAAARINGLAAALLGVGLGAALHTASHVIGRDLGGNPRTDIPTFAVFALVLLAAGAIALGRAGGSSERRSGRG